MYSRLPVAILVLLVLSHCKQSKQKTLPAIGSSQAMQAPTTLVNVPFTEFTVKAETGDTLAYNGSIIFFPPNAFVDKNGKPVAGNVQVKYRELNDPVDFYLSGIPMNYDSAGTRYAFQSIAMCEILAYQNGEPAFVNPSSQPEISLVERTNVTGGNLYYFDSTAGNWVSRGTADKNKVADIYSVSAKGKALNYRAGTIPLPVKPRKADGRLPVIRLLIDSSSFDELKVYNNLRFEIDTSKQRFDPTDAEREWNTVNLEKGKEAGTYIVKYANAEKSVQYVARPVVEEKDYEKAIITFNNKMAEYSRRKQQRSESEREQIVKDSAQFERMGRLRAMIEARNRKVRIENVATEAENREIAIMNNSTSVLRTFKIDGFGVWNIDKMMFMETFPVTAIFQDSAGNELSLKNIAVIEREANGIWRFPDNHITLAKNADNMIIGTFNNRIAWLSFKEFRKYKVSPGSTQVFMMKIFPENQHNYVQMKSLMLQ